MALISGDRRIPWIWSVPVANSLGTLKYHVRINWRVLGEDTDPNRAIRYIDIGTVNAQGKIGACEEFIFANAPSRARRLPVHGDTIVSTVRTYLRAIAYVETPPPDTVCSTGFAVITPGPTLDDRYLGWWLRSDYIIDEICARSVGVSYPAVNAWELGSLPVPLLSLERQRRIAAFLDRKTAAVDALINKKERLIELLQQKRQALVTQAVTQGLEPKVPMKESGVDWIGKMPGHWNLRRLKQVSSRVVVGIAQAATHAYAESGVPIVRSTNVRANLIDIEDLLYIDEAFADSLRAKYIFPGDLLTVRTGEAGVTAVVPPQLERCQCFTMLITTPRKEHCPEYFSFQLNSHSGRIYFARESWGTAQANISVPILQNTPVAVPPPEEQREIVRHIEMADLKTAKLVKALSHQRQSLQEYRQALISAAVTGQLDLSREAA